MKHSKPANYLLTVCAILLVGFNLRPIMASIGPILSTVQQAIGINDSVAGFLTTLPVFAMGLFALLGGYLQSRIGVKRVVTLGLIGIALATLARSFAFNEAGLILTSAVAGIGIAVIQAVMPGFIKSHHPARSGQLMSLFTVGIMAGAMLASASTAPLSQWIPWHDALAVWGILGIMGLVIWLVANRKGNPHLKSPKLALPIKAPRAWLLMLFFGIGTSAYVLVLAWLPPFYVSLGWSNTESGVLLSTLTLFEVISALTLSAFIDRFNDRRPVCFVIMASVIIGLLCLLIRPELLAIPAIIFLGMGIGALFPVSLIVTADHLEDASQTGALMGFVQGGGYMLASVMPTLAGSIRAELNSLDMAWFIMLIGILIQTAMVVKLAPNAFLTKPDWRLSRKM